MSYYDVSVKIEMLSYVLVFAGKVSPVKRLRGGVRFLEIIPKSAAGKILRKDLRKLLVPTAKL